MYLRHTTIRKDGKVHRYWRVVRSVRVGRRVIQQTVAQLGELDEQGRVQARALAHRLIGTPECAQLFDDGSEQLTVPVRLKGIRIERPRQFGDVYLALALWRGTGLEALCERLLPIGKERIAWSKMAAVLVAARFCEPSSELHIAGTGIDERRFRICFSSVTRRSTRIGSIAGSIIFSPTRASSKRICRSAAASCLQSRTRNQLMSPWQSWSCAPSRASWPRPVWLRDAANTRSA